jgi:hypothetical protein
MLIKYSCFNNSISNHVATSPNPRANLRSQSPVDTFSFGNLQGEVAKQSDFLLLYRSLESIFRDNKVGGGRLRKFCKIEDGKEVHVVKQQFNFKVKIKDKSGGPSNYILDAVTGLRNPRRSRFGDTDTTSVSESSELTSVYKYLKEFANNRYQLLG